jgi:hypothetical protein
VRVTARLAVCVAGLLLAFSSCGQKEAPSQVGELIVALQTDMELPKDVDKVRIRVASFGNTVFSNDYQVGPSDLKIPATLGLLANPDRPSSPVTIQVIAFRQGKPRVIRETITTIPQQRVATLRMPIEWLCNDSAREDGGEVVSTCPTGETCAGGTCVTSQTDSAKLPDFSSGEIFGGGDGSGNGSCFDVAQCFGNSLTLAVEPTSCRTVIPADDPNLNLALKLPGTGDGICSGGVCLVPLDGGDGGQWARTAMTHLGVEIQLPPAACERMKAGKIESVIASRQCPTKTARNPTCGPWSSTGSGPRTEPGDGGFTPGAEAGPNTWPDASCPMGNCPPPGCQPPLPPTDGGMCTGILSMPPVSSTACTWDVPGGISWSGTTGFCSNLLNVQLVNVAGMPGPPMILPHVSPGMCGQSAAWQFQMGTAQLELCPAACSTAMSPGVRVEFVYGCPTIGGPPFMPDGGPVFPPDGGLGPPDGGSPPGGGKTLFIAGGTFMIGCAPGDSACGADEMPYHQVSISAFSIDETEVSQGAYDACVRAGVCAAPPCSWQPASMANWPVACVGWDDANKFCGWVNKRLPSEAEWEVAARGTTSAVYPWGNATPDCSRANFSLCSFIGPHASGSFMAGRSASGALDMAGNVAEWVGDWYGPYEAASPMNPMGPPGGTMRILRGGDFRSQAPDIRASRRQAVDPVMRVDSTGFRCARPG